VRKLLLKNWRDVVSRKAQFGALIVLVALGITSYIALSGSQRNLQASYDETKQRLAMASFTVTVIRAPKTALTRILALPGVETAEGRLIFDVGVGVGEDDQVSARVIGIPSDRRLRVNKLIVDEGHYLQPGVGETALLERHFAEARGVAVGDTLELIIEGERRPVRIVGIVTSPEYLLAQRSKSDIGLPGEFAVMFLPQEEVERLFGRPPSFTEFEILVKPGSSRARVVSEAERILDPFHVLETTLQEDQPSNFSIQEEIRQNEQLGSFMPTLILTIAALSLSIALSRLVQSQRGEIGLAKALGYSNRQVLLHYLLFAMFVALAGSGLGLILGQILGRATAQLYSSFYALPFLRTPVYPDLVLSAISLSAFACLVAGVAPAYRSAKIPPAIAMRSDPSIGLVKGSVPIVERVISRFVRLPFSLRIPLRNVFRARRRSFYTIVGMSFAVLLTLSTFSFFDIIDYLFDYQFGRVENYDVTAGFSQSFGRGQVNFVESLPGVESVQPALVVPATLRANGVEHETGLIGMEPSATFHAFDIADGPPPRVALEAGGAVMTPLIARKLGIGVGDGFTAETPFVEDVERPITLLALSEELVGSPIFISHRQARQMLRAPGDVYNSLYLDVDESMADRVREQLYDLPGAEIVVVKQSLVSGLEELIGATRGTFIVLFAFAFTMGFVVVYNTFTANVLERQREIATMRTIGEDRTHLVSIITLENLLLAIVGIPLGIWLGVLAVQAMFASFQTEAFAFTPVIFPRSYLYSTGSMLIVLLFSEIFPIRRIFKLDLAEATKVIE